MPHTPTTPSTPQKSWRPWPLLLACGLLCSLAPTAYAARLALVIGNDQYRQVAGLKNARNDARLMAATLTAAGFEVVGGVRADLDRNALWRALEQFKARVRKGDEVVFYFAGHGVQVEANQLLLPVDIANESEDQVARDAVPLHQVQRQLADAQFALLVIDACRDNPFPPKPGSTRSIGGTRGLAPPAQALDGSVVLLAAAAGQRALDSVPGVTTSNGLFTHELVKALKTPGQGVLAAVRQTRAQVEAQARRVNHAQRPSYVDEMSGEFVLFPATASAASPPPSPQHAVTPSAPPPPTPTEAVGAVWKDCADCPELVGLPIGRFTMGSPEARLDRGASDGPAHTVTINYRLAVGRYEVTRRQFARFVQASGYQTEAERNVDGLKGCQVWNGSAPAYAAGRSWNSPGFVQTEDHPVVCVSWHDAQAYVRWLNGQVHGKAYRLLSEAEWEYAARAGTRTSFPWGESGEAKEQCSYANVADATMRAKHPGAKDFPAANCDDGFAFTAPVGQFKANAFGLHDMVGNVWEWVEDVSHDNYRGAPTDGSAWTSGSDQNWRVLRGGTFGMHLRTLELSYRFRSPPGERRFYVGFRIARIF